VRRGSNGGQWQRRRSSPGGWVGGGAAAKIRQLEGSPVGWSGRKAEGRGGCSCCPRGAGVEGGKRKGGAAARLFYTDVQRWGTVDGVAPCGKRGLRERERERGRGRGGVPPRPADGAPAGSGLKQAGVGGMARPCRTAGLNRGGGGRLTGGAPVQWRAEVESVEKEIQIRLNSNDFKLFQNLTAPKIPFSSSKNLK
jgi:hypothetical protein